MLSLQDIAAKLRDCALGAWWYLRVIIKPDDRSEIDPGLFQGGATNRWDAYDAILDVQLEHEDRPTTGNPGHAYAWMPIADAPPFPGVKWLHAAVLTVAAWRSQGWTVLIHCMQGMSRSGMVDVAYHMYLNKWSRDCAINYVKSKRPITNPNPAFMAGLLEYENFLRSNRC